MKRLHDKYGRGSAAANGEGFVDLEPGDTFSGLEAKLRLVQSVVYENQTLNLKASISSRRNANELSKHMAPGEEEEAHKFAAKNVGVLFSRGGVGIRHFDKKAIRDDAPKPVMLRVFSPFVFANERMIATITLRQEKDGNKLYAIEALEINKDTDSERTPRGETAPFQNPVSQLLNRIAYYIGDVKRTCPMFLFRPESFSVTTAAELIIKMANSLLPTVVIPVKNDANNLASCLPLLKDFDEVVIVDSGSTDETAKVAAEYGREVVQFAWNGQFPKKRNWALRNLTFKHPWVMFLDADERMTPAFAKELGEFLRSERAADVDVISCVFDNWFAGKLMRHGDAMRKTAIVRVGAAEYEKIDEDHWSNLDMEIHEHLQPRRAGAEHEIRARLEHHDKRSLESHWQKHVQYANWEAGRYAQLLEHPERWASLTSRQKKKYANITKWWLAPAYFVVCYFLKRGFLDGVAGLRFAWFKLKYFRLVRATILRQR